MSAVSQKHDRNSSELRGCPYRGRRELQAVDLPLNYASPPGAPRLRMLLRVVPSWLIRLRAAAPPHALQRERSGRHPSRGRLPQHTRRRLRHRTQAELRVWQTACDEKVEPRTIPASQADLNRPRFPRDDQHGVNRGASWPVDESCPYGVAHLGRALLGFGFASSGS